MRLLSYSEVSKALTCQASWDFAYGGHLAGSSLKRKATAPKLQAGRAWGAGVAAWHAHTGELFALGSALDAVTASLNRDAVRQQQFGYYDEGERRDTEERLARLLSHHAESTDPFRVERLEEEIIVPIPSRTGRRASNRYGFIGYFDAVTTDYRPGEFWLVEYKLRDSFFPVALITNSRQLRWYAWAYQVKYGIPVHGVLVEERLSDPPKPARLVKSKRKRHEHLDGEYPMVASHEVKQLTTAGAYVAACHATFEEPQQHVFEALKARRWSQRVPVDFLPGELDESGRELVSAAKLIRDLDSGEMLPIRNVRPQNCNGCFFREICPNPDDAVVGSMFERTVPKRDRPPLEEAEKEAMAA